MIKDKKLMYLNTAVVERDEGQPRQNFDEEALQQLADSIKTNGQIQPIEVVLLGNGRYRIVHGERRWRACKLAGVDVQAIITEKVFSEAQLHVRQIEENLHRQNLNPIEEAKSYQRLLSMTRENGRKFAIATVSRRIGRSHPHITGRLRWLDQPEEIQQLVAERRLPIQKEVAVALESVPLEQRVPLAEKLAARRASSRAIINACSRVVEALKQKRGRQKAGDESSVPMLRTAGISKPKGGKVKWETLRQTAAQACRSCDLYSLAERQEPAWEMLLNHAKKTCENCGLGDDPKICKLCPAVTMLKTLYDSLEKGV